MINLSKINFSNMKGNNQIMEHDLNKALEKIEKAKQTMDQKKKLITSLVSISETTAGHSLDVLKRMDTSKDLTEEASSLSQQGQNRIKEAVFQMDKINQKAEDMVERIKQEGVSETSKGIKKVDVSRTIFGQIQEKIDPLRHDHNQVYNQVSDVKRLSQEMETLSKPIADNRIHISEGLEANRQIQHQIHHSSRL
jgi:N-acetylmuramoyl-L-alanine amidase CwlA